MSKPPPITRWLGRPTGTLRRRLLALSLAPLLLAFPLILAVLVALSGHNLDRLLSDNALSKLDGFRFYLQQVRDGTDERLKLLAATEQLPDALARHLATGGRDKALGDLLATRARAAQLDFLIVATSDGAVIASSIGTPPGRTLPNTFVTRQARTGVSQSAFERLSAEELARLSPALAQSARIETIGPAGDSAAIETSGLLIDAGIHLPLSDQYPNAILFAGVLLNRNATLIDHVREIVFPVTAQARSFAGTTSIYLDGLRVATNALRPGGGPAVGEQASPQLLAEVLEQGASPVRRTRVGNAWEVNAYEAIVDGEGKRIGMIAVGLSEAPYAREKWLVVGSIAVLLALAMFALTLLNLAGTRQLTQRLARITDAMSAVRRGDRAILAGRSEERDEIGRLAQDFDGLVRAIAEKEEAQRRFQAVIAAEASRRRALFEHVRDGIVVVTEDGSIFEANHSFGDLVGSAPEDLVGVPVVEFAAKPDPAVVAATLRNVSPAGETYEGVLRRRDGSTFDAEVSVSRIEWGGEAYVMGVVRDITARNQAARELHAAQREAADANAAKAQFLAQMSHEIRTPMNAIIGLAQVLEHDPLPEESARTVRTIGEAGQSLLRIVNDILDFSKIEAGQLPIVARPFAVSEVLTRVDQLLSGSAAAKGLRLDIDRPPPQVDRVDGDALRLEQILVNLVGNAIKFTTQGSVSIAVAPLDVNDNSLRLRFEVRDTGIGIETSAIDGLFEPFTQADSGITRRYGGTGLGLSICKRLVELMGGRIGATSTPAVGSTFWFDLPFERVREAPATVGAGTGTVRPPVLAGLRVLAVDDSSINRYVLERALGRVGAIVTPAEDGREALRLLHSDPTAFDIVLMDVQMPGLDGLATTRAMRGEPALAAIAVIGLSAGVLSGEREAALAAGMNGFVPKPVDLRQLVDELVAIRDARSVAT